MAIDELLVLPFLLPFSEICNILSFRSSRKRSSATRATSAAPKRKCDSHLVSQNAQVNTISKAQHTWFLA
jgi:hypothetical protein